MCHFLTNYIPLLNNFSAASFQYNLLKHSFSSIFKESIFPPLLPCGCECINVTVANLLTAWLVDACGGLWSDGYCRYHGERPLRRNHCWTQGCDPLLFGSQCAAFCITDPTISAVPWMLSLTITAISVRFCCCFPPVTSGGFVSAQDTSTSMVLL
jgi:hypothetical protein